MGSLDLIDNLRDNGINSGIGNSGLASQAIQRSNIEELKNLRGAISESQITSQNADEARRTQLTQEFMKNSSTIYGQQGRGQGGLNPNAPLTTIQDMLPAGATDNSSSGVGRFQINIPGSSNSPRFSTYEEAAKYLEQSYGQGNYNLAYQSANPIDAQLRSDIASRGGQILPFSATTTGHGNPMGRTGQLKSANAKPVDLSSGVNLTTIDPSTRGKLVSDTYDQLARQASQGIGLDIYSTMKAALSAGKATEFVQAYLDSKVVKKGKK